MKSKAWHGLILLTFIAKSQFCLVDGNEWTEDGSGVANGGVEVESGKPRGKARTTTLGDLKTSDAANELFFEIVDQDNDGEISKHEVRQYINETGGKGLDDQDEILHAAGLSFPP